MKRVIYPYEVLDIFKRIDRETIVTLGMDPEYNLPENLIIKILIIAP